MKTLFIVFFGGGLGSLVRYSLSQWISTLHRQSFPWGTFTVNVAACFTLGLIVGLADYKQMMSPSARLFWTVGFCGGFSTFSTFSNEILLLLQAGMNLSLLSYIIASLVICVSTTYAGILLGQAL